VILSIDVVDGVRLATPVPLAEGQVRTATCSESFEKRRLRHGFVRWQADARYEISCRQGVVSE